VATQREWPPQRYTKLAAQAEQQEPVFRPLEPALQESSVPVWVLQSGRAKLAALAWLPVVVALSSPLVKLVLAEADLRASLLLQRALELPWARSESASPQAQTESLHWALERVRLELRNCPWPSQFLLSPARFCGAVRVQPAVFLLPVRC
jgi:hypothetical protein